MGLFKALIVGLWRCILLVYWPFYEAGKRKKVKQSNTFKSGSGSFSSIPISQAMVLSFKASMNNIIREQERENREKWERTVGISQKNLSKYLRKSSNN